MNNNLAKKKQNPGFTNVMFLWLAFRLGCKCC